MGMAHHILGRKVGKSPLRSDRTKRQHQESKLHNGRSVLELGHLCLGTHISSDSDSPTTLEQYSEQGRSLAQIRGGAVPPEQVPGGNSSVNFGDN